jgi:hypothetical protein
MKIADQIMADFDKPSKKRGRRRIMPAPKKTATRRSWLSVTSPFGPKLAPLSQRNGRLK